MESKQWDVTSPSLKLLHFSLVTSNRHAYRKLSKSRQNLTTFSRGPIKKLLTLDCSRKDLNKLESISLKTVCPHEFGINRINLKFENEALLLQIGVSSTESFSNDDGDGGDNAPINFKLLGGGGRPGIGGAFELS